MTSACANWAGNTPDHHYTPQSGQRPRTADMVRQLDRQFDCLGCVPNGRFCVASLPWGTCSG
jgi:hypothetical protein